jgi:hypothetical protein
MNHSIRGHFVHRRVGEDKADFDVKSATAKEVKQSKNHQHKHAAGGRASTDDDDIAESSPSLSAP